MFFDEIDSLASKRGGYGTAGAKVSENVLNQLLAEMDGIELPAHLKEMSSIGR